MASATAHPNHQLISSEDVEGVNVYDTQGKKIGEIDHLMIDKISGRVTYAVMSFGGFLGLGHSHYPLPWGALKYSTKLNGFETSVTEAQLRTHRPSATTPRPTGTGRPRRTRTITSARTGKAGVSPPGARR